MTGVQESCLSSFYLLYDRTEKTGMAQKAGSGIEKIIYGEIHSYYPLKFETDLDFEALCETVRQSTVFFSE